MHTPRERGPDGTGGSLCPGSGMSTSYSQESALQRALEVYFNGKKGKDTDDFRTMLFLQTELETVCLALTRAGSVRRQFAFYTGGT